MESKLIKTALVICAVALVTTLAWSGDAKSNDVALWIARSCVGEAGWKSHETGECAAIAHIYKKRSAINGWSYYRTMRKYSGAIKRHRGHSREWLFGLKQGAVRPIQWPSRLKWSEYEDDWQLTLDMARRFVSGEIDDPLPRADHYGSWVDRHRVLPSWELLPTPNFKNWFFNERRNDAKTD
jgi:hypothetical protein